MTVREFIQKIKSGEAKVLTVETAKELRGKRIAWMYFGDKSNSLTVQEMTVGDIVSELDYMETQPCEGYNSRADYWRTFMDKDRLDEAKTILILLDENGGTPFMYAHTKYHNFYDEPTFTCTDADREVYFIEL